MNTSQLWKTILVTPSTDAEFDLNAGTFNVTQGTTGIKMSQSMGFQGTVTEVVLKGEHSSGRPFEVICTWNGSKWKHSGELLDSGIGGNGTWTAEEGP